MKLYCKLRLNWVAEINANIFNCGMNYFGFIAIPQQQVLQISMTEWCLYLELPKLTLQQTAAIQCLKQRALFPVYLDFQWADIDLHGKLTALHFYFQGFKLIW